MSRVRYGVQIEFTVDDIIAGGPSKATIRRTLRELVEQLREDPHGDSCWASLTDVQIRYLHEATSTQEDRKK